MFYNYKHCRNNRITVISKKALLKIYKFSAIFSAAEGLPPIFCC